MPRQCSSQPASSAVAAGAGHLFLLACGCLVAQRCHARRLGPELSLRPCLLCSRWTFPLSARHLHANSLPASLCLAHRYHQQAECHARPLHASREASTSYLAHPILPLYLYASVPNDVARNRPRRFIVRVFSLLVVYLYTTPYYFLVPAFVLP